MKHSKMKIMQTMSRIKRHLLLTTGRSCFTRLLKVPGNKLPYRQRQLRHTYRRLCVLLNNTNNHRQYGLGDCIQWANDAQVTAEYRAEELMKFFKNVQICFQDINIDHYVRLLFMNDNYSELERYCLSLVDHEEEQPITVNEQPTIVNEQPTNVISLSSFKKNITTSNTTTSYDFSGIMAKNKANKQRLQKEQSKRNRSTLMEYRIKK